MGRDDCNMDEQSLLNAKSDDEVSVLSSNLYLEHVGLVNVTLDSDGLSWRSVESLEDDATSCFCSKSVSEFPTEIQFSETYAVEFLNNGLIQKPDFFNRGRRIPDGDSEMYRFVVNGVHTSKTQPFSWGLLTYMFGHKDMQTCQMWVNQIELSLSREGRRPKNLLVFVNPVSGTRKGWRTWEAVSPIFSRAKVKTKVIVTQRAGQAYDTMASIISKELNLYDGAVIIGGDGFFNEVLNGFLSSRFRAMQTSAPTEFIESIRDENSSKVYPNDIAPRTVNGSERQSPLLSSTGKNESDFLDGEMKDDSCIKEDDLEFPIPSDQFRFGIIPAGSTDAIVMCTTGSRDPVKSALQIVLGKSIHLDIAQIIRWKLTSTSKVEPYLRYAASFAGYGFYGDVIRESEKCRWMGPARYDIAGTKVFLRHRSYEAEISYLDVESEKTNSIHERGFLDGIKVRDAGERVICRVNCNICNQEPASMSTRGSQEAYLQMGKRKWLRSRGRFLSVGAAIISNRNEKAPDGLVAEAHLSDGFLHLLLIKDCSHASYLRHLIQLARKGGNPLNFDFVEHHKTPAFTFTSYGEESIWNVDGEPFQAHKLSAQVLRGLICLFASGPEV